jgi:23S rRNA pseudouridine1911/1915/1917 synthase
VEQELEKAFSFQIEPNGADTRLDVFLASRLQDLTRSRSQELIREGFVRVNGRPPKASQRLREGDLVTVSIPPPQPLNLEPEPIEFQVIHEDASLIVVNKPAGLVVHPAPGHPTGTLVQGLLDHCRDLSGIGGVLRPGIVHRLDKNTSGLMVVAKHDRSHAHLAQQFKTGSVRKTYLAIVHGRMPREKGEIDLPIARHPIRRKKMAVAATGGKHAITLWQRLHVFGPDFSIVAATPKTGRTHQIRVHLAHLGHPIVGDPVYGPGRRWWRRTDPLKGALTIDHARQMLHAAVLGFVHPDSGRFREFKAPLPCDMGRLLKTLKTTGSWNDGEKGLDK